MDGSVDASTASTRLAIAGSLVEHLSGIRYLTRRSWWRSRPRTTRGVDRELGPQAFTRRSTVADTQGFV